MVKHRAFSRWTDPKILPDLRKGNSRYMIYNQVFVENISKRHNQRNPSRSEGINNLKQMSIVASRRIVTNISSYTTDLHHYDHLR